ncbi:GntR family transcriptional regulator [Pseudonocardia hispaniensis]|uniref:GntR family transcriptional regulator n=1 Tax=Pseudonocardia hispaniensis TaxID=904933 RepID=A0ABW1J5K7_9PSEU
MTGFVVEARVDTLAAKGQNGSAVLQVAEVIRERIKQGMLGPGHRLVETDLTGELGVSRGSVREALSRLAAEGLVTVEPYRGAMVRKMTRQDVEHLYQVREVLEGLAARLAAVRMGEPAARKRVTAMLRAMERSHPAEDRQGYLEENTRFHQLIVELGGNPLAAETLRTLSTQIYRYMVRNLLDAQSRVRSCKQHIAVANAVLAGDGPKAERLMRRHVRASGEEVLKIVDALG